MAAYYNEIDAKAAAWLRELIKEGLIADGEVDERSIELVRPDDLAGFVQCHFFAGIGGWSYALRLAGWPDDRPVWTGSCPCQPFSSAGAQAGGADARDLWPAWFRFIAECRPDVVCGEQVEAAIAHGWLDRLCDDLEGEDYAVWPVGLPSASVGAFDKRQRLWFVADAADRRGPHERVGAGPEGQHVGAVTRAGGGNGSRDGAARDRSVLSADAAKVEFGDVAHASRSGLPQFSGRREQSEGLAAAGFWRDADWLECRDGKRRPVEPGTFPLAHGVPARVGRLRGYGNAINPFVAAEVISAYMEIEPSR